MKNKLFVFFSILPFLFLNCSTEGEKRKDTNNTKQSIDYVNGLIQKEENLKIDSIGILLYDKFFELDAIGPYQVLSGIIGTKVFYVAPQKGIITGAAGTQFNVEHSIADIDQLDILIVPGGTIGTVTASKSSKIINWIQKIDKRSTFTTSVCTGSWILGEAGLLKNKKATSNWYRAADKLRAYDIEFVDKRWVKDGKYWTSAGVSAGIDMSLALVKEIKGETYAKLLMLNLEYDPQPPFKGGSVKNTDKELVEYMTKMYDNILE